MQKYLHSNIFKLIRQIKLFPGFQHQYLHSNIFKLILLQEKKILRGRNNLHSNIFKLIPDQGEEPSKIFIIYILIYLN